MNNTNKIYISCFHSSEIIQVDATTGNVEARIKTSKYPYSLIVDKNQIYSANLWGTTPDYIIPIDNHPNNFYLTDPIQVEKNVTAFTNTILVEGISDPTIASVPDVYGVVIYKNDLPVGTKTTVVTGDHIKVQYTTPNSYSTAIEFPLYIGNNSDWFISHTRKIDDIIDPFYFIDIFETDLNSEYVSNEIEITGIDQEVRLVFSINTGSIILNGVDTGISSVVVKIGDKIRIRSTSSPSYCGKTFVSANCGGYVNVWSIVNKKDVERDSKYVLTTDDKGLFDLVIADQQDLSKRYIEKLTGSSVSSTYNLDSTPSANGIQSSVLYVADYINSKIIKIDSNDGVEEVIDVSPDKPFSVAWNGGAVFYTCPESNVVSSLDKTQRFSVVNPRTIVSTVDNRFAVAAKNGIAIFSLNNTSYEYTGTLNVPNTSLYDVDVYSRYATSQKYIAKFTPATYYDISKSSTFNLGSSDFTFESYIKIDPRQTSSIYLLSRSNSTGTNTGSSFNFYLKYDFVTSSFSMECELYSTLTSNNILSSDGLHQSKAIINGGIGNSLDFDKWYHVAYVRKSNQVLFYLNGIQIVPTVNFHHIVVVPVAVAEFTHELIYSTQEQITYTNNNGLLPDINEQPFYVNDGQIICRVGNYVDVNGAFYSQVSNLALTLEALYSTSWFEFFPDFVPTSTRKLLMFNNVLDAVDHSYQHNTVTRYANITFITDTLFTGHINTYYATDVLNHKVHEVIQVFGLSTSAVRSLSVGRLPYSLSVNESKIFVANFGGSSLTEVNRDTFVSVETLLPEKFSLPTSVMIDGDRVLVSPYRDSYVLQYKNSTFTPIPITSNCYNISNVDGSIWLTELYGELLDNSNVGAFDHIDPIVIPDHINAEFDTLYESDEQVISGQTVRPITLHLEPYVDASIIKNGVDVGHITSFVVGDKFKIKAKSLSFYKKPKTVGLYSCGFQTSFTIITVPDLQPDIMIFDAYYDAILRSRIYTQEMPITGIDGAEELEIEILGYNDSINSLIEPQLIVNGVHTESSTAKVKLGDTIGFSVLVKGITWNGYRLPVKIRTSFGFEFAFIDIYTAYLNGPIHENKPEDIKAETEYDDSVTYTRLENISGYDSVVPDYTIVSVSIDGILDTAKSYFYQSYEGAVLSSSSLLTKDNFGYDIFKMYPAVTKDNFGYTTDITYTQSIALQSYYGKNDSTTFSHLDHEYKLNTKATQALLSASYYSKIIYRQFVLPNWGYSIAAPKSQTAIDANQYINSTPIAYTLIPSQYKTDVNLSVHAIDTNWKVFQRNVMSSLDASYSVYPSYLVELDSHYDSTPLYTYHTLNASYLLTHAVTYLIDLSGIKLTLPMYSINTTLVVLPSAKRQIDTEPLTNTTYVNTLFDVDGTKQNNSGVLVSPTILPPYPSLDKIISPKTVVYPALNKFVGPTPVHNVCLSKCEQPEYVHNVCLAKTKEPEYTHNVCLAKDVSPSIGCNTNVDKHIESYPEYVAPKFKTIEVGPIHNVPLSNFVDTSVEINTCLTKFVDTFAEAKSYLHKSVESYFEHNMCLNKAVDTSTELASSLNKVLTISVVHNVCLSKIIDTGPVRNIPLSRGVDVSVEHNVCSNKEIESFAEYSGCLTKSVVQNAVHNAYLGRVITPTAIHNVCLDKTLTPKALHNVCLDKVLEPTAIHNVCLDKTLTPKALHNVCLDKVLEPTAIHNVCLDKVLEPTAIHNVCLDKAIQPTAIHNTQLAKVVTPNAIHNGCLDKIVYPKPTVHAHTAVTNSVIPEVCHPNKASAKIEFNIGTIASNWIDMRYSVNNVVVTDNSNMLTTQDKRTFRTAQDAIADGISNGYKSPKAFQLQDGSYMWYVPSKIIMKHCSVGGKVYPVAWYVHGG